MQLKVELVDNNAHVGRQCDHWVTFSTSYSNIKTQIWIMVRIMRQSSCGTLNLPVKWACDRCKPSIEKAKITNKQNKLIRSCIKPWDEKFKNHREASKAQRSKDIHQHLENVWIESFIDEDNNATVTSNGRCFEDAKHTSCEVTLQTTKLPPATPTKLLNSFPYSG